MTQGKKLSELLVLHKARIQKLRQLVESKSANIDVDKINKQPQQGELYYTKIDDIFYLRHVLSAKAKTTDKALAESVVLGLEWRLQNINSPPTNLADLQDHLAVGHTGDLPNGSPVSVFSLAQSNLKKLKKADDNKLDEYMKSKQEELYQICDERSRAQDKLVKVISVVDCKGVSVFQSFTVVKVCKAIGSGRGFKPHPQLQQSKVLLNLNPVLKSSAGPLLKKFEVIGVDSFIQDYKAVNAVPTFIGGSSNELWNKSRSSVSWPASSSGSGEAYSQVILEGSGKEWKLKAGADYSWDIQVTNPRSIVSVICTPKDGKRICVSAKLVDEKRETLITFAEETVHTQVITFPCGGHVGTLVLKVRNGAKNLSSKVKNKMKNKMKIRNCLGSISFVVEAPDSLEDGMSYLSNALNSGEDFFTPGSALEMMRKDKELSSQGSSEESFKDSFSESYLAWLIPLVPDVMVNAVKTMSATMTDVMNTSLTSQIRTL